ncbi:hypothetical protein DFH09DRAFT_1413150 [Mycena vulgaris]|nr:hypothetical protein DFH09DRAFT_1413150 [Mycena vulgaris]
MPPKNNRKGTPATSRTGSEKCSTLMDDEFTRCFATPTHGTPVQRCRLHHKQYCTMTKRYKEAQKFVDETLGGSLIPSKADIKYVNAIRVERTGREIHHNQFFMKVDDGHKIRIKVLAKQMAQGVELRDALEARALNLHLGDHPGGDWIGTPIDDENDRGPQPGEDIFSYMRSQGDKAKQQAALNKDDDLIELQLRFQSDREKLLWCFEHILNPEKFWADYRRKTKTEVSDTAEERNARNIFTNACLQHTRRIVKHDPHLFAKSYDKVSIKDLIMDDDFGADDVLRVMNRYQKRLTTGLTWWKDCLTEAIAMKDSSEASANMGALENRFKILGGWIYNNFRNTPAPNKVWWTMFMKDPPEKDTENRYVRLCCNFDELYTFLTFSTLMLSNTAPSFLTDSRNFDPPRNAIATRNHLSLCGVFVTDMVSGDQKAKFPCPVPSQIPAKARGCITWVEVQICSYIFGALRNEPDDFTDAFLRELRARPDLFAVITRSDTDPSLKVESFGDVTDQMRVRQFEAPFQPVKNAPIGRGEWDVCRTAMNVLYGGGKAGICDKEPGYLSHAFNDTTDAKGRKETSFFTHKRFPVKYFLILDASPTGHVHDLARQMAWAAFRAKGLVQGNYDERRYDKASDVLFTKHARERLSFLPDGDYPVGNLASRE